jgi:hypothetical protein
MDLGCYSLHAHPVLAPWGEGEPTLVDARGGGRDGVPGIDEWVDGQLAFPSGVTGLARYHMAWEALEMTYRIVGSRGEAKAADFVLPNLDDRLFITIVSEERVEELASDPATPTAGAFHPLGARRRTDADRRQRRGGHHDVDRRPPRRTWTTCRPTTR